MAARAFAQAAHAGCCCRDGVTPYFVHVERVAALVRDAGYGDDVVAAAYLHDVIEHAGVSREAIRDGFGAAVLRLVDAVTQPSVVPETRRRVKWVSRKRGAVIAANGAPDDAVALKAADLVTNIAELVRDADRDGAAAWDRYEAGGARQAGYYLALGAVLSRRVTNGMLAANLAEALASLRRAISAHGITPRGRYTQRPAARPTIRVA
jgi:guanosine-3',5'-bis(diphosphate) 3'-pyrophosphohydrolase